MNSSDDKNEIHVNSSSLTNRMYSSSFSQLHQKLNDNELSIFIWNGKGSVVDQYGRSDPTDYIVDEEQFRLETLNSHKQYLAQLPLGNEEVFTRRWQ